MTIFCVCRPLSEWRVLLNLDGAPREPESDSRSTILAQFGRILNIGIQLEHQCLPVFGDLVADLRLHHVGRLIVRLPVEDGRVKEKFLIFWWTRKR